VKFAFTHAHVWRITTMYRVLEVSRAEYYTWHGYYMWRVRLLCEQVKTDQLPTEKIGGIQDDVQRRYSSLRVWGELKACLSRG
jgi:hypothetical protein